MGPGFFGVLGMESRLELPNARRVEDVERGPRPFEWRCRTIVHRAVSLLSGEYHEEHLLFAFDEETLDEEDRAVAKVKVPGSHVEEIKNLEVTLLRLEPDYDTIAEFELDGIRARLRIVFEVTE